MFIYYDNDKLIIVLILKLLNKQRGLCSEIDEIGLSKGVKYMDDDKFKKNYSMQTLHRAMQILRSFSIENKTLSLTELHKTTGLSKSSLQRLLSTMVFEGLLQKNTETKRYQLGLELLFLGNLVEKNTSLLSIAQPIMKDLRLQTGESISLNVIENHKRKCIENLTSNYELQTMTFVGQESPLYAGASAKVLLAYYPKQMQRDYIKSIKLEKLAENTIVEQVDLLDELERIKEKGYAFSNGERVKGAVSISAPIFNPFEEIIAGVSLIVPSPRFDEYDEIELINLLKEGAKAITNKLRNFNQEF
ncbi:IclR family transcriptional regulator [Cytobacillus purgationiresistens]|uniref:DNA-binding IclR family transcriptional regulator n=1 Tax=Cytobacillus purgationiresistens TaxID=863449 RepID=A0ABU0AL49_9BACI|nr:IclR family transcriptional regulator [Cytobacillus purgationiresistens]MDQ0271992.1 DNA-binding IclR family transcriptional regulator [Cytobacillus purgationiresistens]